MPAMSIRVHKNLQKSHEYKLQITNFVICKILYFHNLQFERNLYPRQRNNVNLMN